MQWYSPFQRINSGTRFGHTPAALCCRRPHLAALPASGPGASASAGGAPALLGASASAGGAPALRGTSAARGSPRSSRAERKEDGAIRRMGYTFRRMVCTCPFRGMVCYTLHSWGPLTPAKRARIALGEQGRRPVPWLVCTTASCKCVAALGPSITSVPSCALLFVLFGGWFAPAVTHVSYLSFSADGVVHMSPICLFRRMVC